MQKFICFLLLLGFIFSGCESDDEERKLLTVQEPRLDYYLESYDIPDLGFQPQSKVIYEYTSSGKLSKYRVLTYDPDLKSLVEQRHFDFVYGDGVLTKIIVLSSEKVDPDLQYVYEYFPDGRVSKIKETNKPAGVNSEANFIYDDANRSTKVLYTFSNGGSVQYEFHVTNGNIVKDKTTRGSQLCNDGQYTYDDHINPFKTLGYTDYFVTNLSGNNKLTESANYVGCAFPTFIPVSYSYEYNNRGYPTVMTTFFKTGSGIRKSKREIFYK